jgi:peptide/nickel transport system permease protein
VDSLLAGDVPLFWSAVQHLILPSLVLAASAIGVVTRFCRAGILEVLQTDYVTAARAKGLPERTVITRYVLRAALVPVVTLLGVVFAGLLSGAVLTETIFSWPGIGQYAFLATASLDINAIIAVTLFVGLVYSVLNLVVDLLYGVIDPRIRAE